MSMEGGDGTREKVSRQIGGRDECKGDGWMCRRRLGAAGLGLDGGVAELG